MGLLRILSVVLLLALPGRAEAITGERATVTGVVTAAEEGQPLSGALVTAERGGARVGRVLTDEAGRYVLPGIEPGPLLLRAELVGYAPGEAEVRVGPSGRSVVDIALVPLAIPLDPLQIIANTSSAPEGLTGAATRIGAPVIDLVRPMGTQEILQYVPGVHGFADDGMGNSRLSIGIRGLNPRRSSRVLVLEDGIPIQPALYIYPNMYYNPPAERIERVEVIKGSGAIRYGPQTMGGVVNYITGRPSARQPALAEVTGGTNGYMSVFGDVPLSRSRTFRPAVQLLYKRGDGYRENNAFEQYNATFKVHVLPAADRVVYIKGNVNHEDSEATYTGLTEYSFRTDPRFNPKSHDNFRVFRSSLDVLISDRLSPRLDRSTKFYLNYFDRRWWRENDVFVRAQDHEAGEIRPVAPYQPGDLVRVGGGVDNTGILRTFYVGGLERTYSLGHRLFGAESTLELGGRIHFERFIDDKKRGATPSARDGVYFTGDPEDPPSITIVGQSHHYETAALALHAGERIRSGRWTLEPGLRLELFEQERIDRLRGARYADKTSFVLLPGLGANYDLGAAELFGGIHRGYTPPSSGTLKVVNFGQDVASGGLDLKPETSWNSEVGVRTALPWLGLEAAAFHTLINDLVAAGRGTAFKNLGKVATYGLELGATVAASTLTPLLPDLNVAYTYLATEVLEGTIVSAVLAGGVEVDIAGNELPYAPRHTLVAGLSRRFDSGLALRADVRYVDRVYTDFENIEVTYNRGDTGPVSAYTIVNGSARYRFGDGIEARVTAKNLFDTVYIGSRLHSNPGQPEAHLSSGILPGPRRQINLGIGYRF